MTYDIEPWKDIDKLYDYEVSPTKFIEIGNGTRSNNERVTYIRARKLYDGEVHFTPRVRVPPYQMKNVTDALEVIKKENENGADLDSINEKFKNKHRFSVGRNSDLVIDMQEDERTEENKIFMRYQPEPGKVWRSKASQSKGVTIPMESIPKIIDGFKSTDGFND